MHRLQNSSKMIISYFLSILALQSEMVFQYSFPHLFDLICFSLPISRLKIEDFFNSILGKDVMIPFNSLIKLKPFEQTTKCFEGHVCIRSPQEDVNLEP